MSDVEIMHTSVNGGYRLLEWPLKVGEMVLLAVMMRDRTGRIVQRRIADKRHAAVDQGQHILRHVRVEQLPGIANRHVDWRRMGKAAALPDIVMPLRFKILRSAAPG